MSNESFFKNAIQGLSDKCIQAIAIRQSDLHTVQSLINNHEDKQNFVLSERFGKYMLKHTGTKKGVIYA